MFKGYISFGLVKRCKRLLCRCKRGRVGGTFKSNGGDKLTDSQINKISNKVAKEQPNSEKSSENE